MALTEAEPLPCIVKGGILAYEQPRTHEKTTVLRHNAWPIEDAVIWNVKECYEDNL